MQRRRVRFVLWATFAAGAVVLGNLALAQGIVGGFEGFWGSRYVPGVATRAGAPIIPTAIAQPAGSDPAPVDARGRLVHWNRIAIDASGLDHTPVGPGETRVFGEQLGPGRSSRAMAIVHIAIFDAVNAIEGRWKSYTGILPAPNASVNAAIAQAAHDTLASLFPSQADRFKQAFRDDLVNIPEVGKSAGRTVGRRAAAAILGRRKHDGSETPEPRVGIEFITSNAPGKWRQDPVSQIPIALGAYWGGVKPFVLRSGAQYRVKPPPALSSLAYAAAFDEVKRLGGDGRTTSTERTDEQTTIGTYWAYDGVPTLGTPPRLYNQIAMTIADQMGSDFLELTRLLTLINVALADGAIASWESKYYYQFWRPVTGIREADPDTGPSGLGDGNDATIGDPAFVPLGAPASNLSGPDFTPPFPAYPSGHATLGGAFFDMLRRFYGTDNIPFTFTSDEYNGMTYGSDGVLRAVHPRSFQTLSQAEEENGQSRIYLGIHWSFDKTEGIVQGHRVARYVIQNAFLSK